jgi:uncharacterized LabA/DUF88 family protein/cold shock CspA family protein
MRIIMETTGYQKVGIYVDVSNIAQNGGYGMQYDVLREFGCRNYGIAVRLNAYVAFDEEKSKTNPEYRIKSQNFHATLRDFGFKVIVKKVRFFYDEFGNRYGKANADLDMAVDALSQSDRLDSVLLVSGDGDFAQVIRALQNKGCRVECLAFKNVSHLLKTEADVFTSGYLVPDLLPPVKEYPEAISALKWGEEGSVIRGICYAFYREKGFGFMRVMKSYQGGLWITDSRKDDSPYMTVFVHESQIPESISVFSLPNRDQVFEFRIQNGEKGFQAVEVTAITPTQ